MAEKKLINYLKESELILLCIVSIFASLSQVAERIFSFFTAQYAIYILLIFTGFSLLRVGFARHSELTKLYPPQEKKELKYKKWIAYPARFLGIILLFVFIILFIYDAVSLSPQDRKNLNDHLILGELYLDKRDWDNSLKEFEQALRIDASNKQAISGFIEAKTAMDKGL